MKVVELTEVEVEVLKEMCMMAVWNANHVTAQAFEANSDQYKAVCRLFNKL